MPGYSELCVSGQHYPACTNSDCRCGCHPVAQELKAKEAVKREEVAPALSAVCPKCGAKQKATDAFCRVDGERLLLGKRCLECGAPGNDEDMFCWQCGVKHGERREIIESKEPAEDPLLRIKRIAVEAGLLKETVI